MNAVEALAERFGRGVAVLVSHRLSTVRAADLILVTEEGRVKELGDHDALLRKGGPYSQPFQLQARSYA